MIQQSITISNKLGLHARASAKLTKLAGSFLCEVWISRGSRRVNAMPATGCAFWIREPGSDDEPGPPPGFNGTMAMGPLEMPQQSPAAPAPHRVHWAA